MCGVLVWGLHRGHKRRVMPATEDPTQRLRRTRSIFCTCLEGVSVHVPAMALRFEAGVPAAGPLCCALITDKASVPVPAQGPADGSPGKLILRAAEAPARANPGNTGSV